MERLNKRIASAGLASRRGADRLIQEGRVTVNGHTVTELGIQVDPREDAVKVDGKMLPAAPAEHTYVVLHKPRGCVTTLADPEGRPTVMDWVKGIKVRLFPVGRLDFNSEGLLLLTDDGELARDLMHPRSAIPKTYTVKVRGNPEAQTLARLSKGIVIEGRKTLPAKLEIRRRGPNAWLDVTVVEGRKHQVRKMLQAMGHPVVKLKRVRYAGLELGALKSGHWRRLTRSEIGRLKKAVATPRRAPRRRPSQRGPDRRN